MGYETLDTITCYRRLNAERLPLGEMAGFTVVWISTRRRERSEASFLLVSRWSGGNVPRGVQSMHEKLEQGWYAEPVEEPSSIAFREIWFAIAVLFTAAILIRLIDLDALPHIDELFTLLAARGYASEGVPRIADGLYFRTELYTAFIAGWFRLFGESLVVARLPSVLAGSALVVAVFVWTRSVAGGLAAWIAALFVTLSPLSIQLSQFARMYAIHGLVLWLTMTCFYALVVRPQTRGRAVVLSAACVLGFLVAIYLQVLTTFAITGIVLWFMLVKGVPWLLAGRLDRRILWGIAAGALALGMIALVVAIETGVLADLFHRYRAAPFNRLEESGRPWYYQLFLVERYPSLWPLFPFTVLLAVAINPKPALFCAIIFSVVFVLLSFGGMKAPRYLFFALPYLFAIWGMALAAAWPYLRRSVVAVTDQAVQRIAPGLPRHPARWVLIVLGIGFLLLANGAPARTLLLPLGVRLEPEGLPGNWAAAKPLLEPWLEKASVVLTTRELHNLYYLGRADIVLSATRLSVIGKGEQFSLDPRTGLPVISSPQALRLVMACHQTGLVLSDLQAWLMGRELQHEVISFIESHLTLLNLPEGLRVRAFSWESSATAVPPPECATLTPVDEAVDSDG